MKKKILAKGLVGIFSFGIFSANLPEIFQVEIAKAKALQSYNLNFDKSIGFDFASSDYCPITNLENDDAAYEWIFCGENKYFPAMWQIQNLKARSKKKFSNDKPVKIDADAEIIKMMNPLNFIGRDDVTVSKYFRIRHGSADRNTSLAIPVILALKL